MRHTSLALVLIVSALIAVVSCSSNRSPVNIANNGYAAESADLGFKIVSQSNEYSANDFVLDMESTGSKEVRVRIAAAGDEFESFLFHLEYPSSELTPTEVVFPQTGTLSDLPDVLTMSVTKIPGIVAVGAVPINKEALPDGYSIEVVFNVASNMNRTLSKTPTGSENAVDNLVVQPEDVDFVTMDWNGKLVGDYDYSGEVGVPDITPIANSYLAITNDGVGDDILETYVDGDNSGEVGISDISVIAQHYLESLIGYHIYYGTPQEPGNPDSEVDWETTPLLTEMDAEDQYLVPVYPGVRGADNTFYRKEIGIDVPSGVLDSDSAWRVVPTDGETEGVPGETVFVSPQTEDTTPPVWDAGISIVSATPGDGEVTVTWGTAVDAENPPVIYIVYYDEASLFDFATANMSVAFNESTHETVITGLSNDTEYTFGVRAWDNSINMNEDENTSTLNATPQIGGTTVIAKIPPNGASQIGSEDVYNSDLAIGPGYGTNSDAIEDGAPLIVYRTESNSLNIAWYNAGWQEEVLIADAGTIVTPRIAIINGLAVIAVFSRTDRSAKLLVGLPTQGFDEYIIDDQLDYVPFIARIAYVESEEKVVIAYSLEDVTDPEQVCVFTAPWDNPKPITLSGGTDVLENTTSSVPSVDLCVNQATSEVSVVYSSGDLDQENMTFDTILYKASRIGSGSWDITNLSNTIGDIKPIFLSADYVDDEVEVTYQNVRVITIPVVEYKVPIFDINVYRGGSSGINDTVFTGQFGVNIFTQTASINFGIESSIVPITGTTNAFATISRAYGDLGVASFPDLTGTVDLIEEGAKQTGTNLASWQSYGMGNARNFSGVYDQQNSRVDAVYVQTTGLDITALSDLSNLPPGPLKFATIAP